MPRLCEECGETILTRDDPPCLGEVGLEAILAMTDDVRAYQLAAIRRGEDPPHSLTLLGMPKHRRRS